MVFIDSISLFSRIGRRRAWPTESAFRKTNAFPCMPPIFRYLSYLKPSRFLSRNFPSILFKNSDFIGQAICLHIFQQSLNSVVQDPRLLYIYSWISSSNLLHIAAALLNLRFRLQNVRYSFWLPLIFDLEYFVGLANPREHSDKL